MSNMSEVRKVLAARSQVKEQNSDDKKATESESAAMKGIYKLFGRGIFETENGDKLNCIIDVILSNQSLHKFISDIPCDELEIILDEAVNNQSFIDLFKFVNESSTRLSALRERKREDEEKKLKRKKKGKQENEQPQLFSGTEGAAEII